MEDEPKQKPRRAFGTPLYRFQARATFGLLVACHLLGAIVVYFKDKDGKRLLTSGYLDLSQYHLDKRSEMSRFQLFESSTTQGLQYDRYTRHQDLELSLSPAEDDLK